MLEAGAATFARTSALNSGLAPSTSEFPAILALCDLGLLIAVLGGVCLIGGGWRLAGFEPLTDDQIAQSVDQVQQLTRTKRDRATTLRSATFLGTLGLAILMVGPVGVYALNSIPTEQVSHATVASIPTSAGCRYNFTDPGPSWNISPPMGSVAIVDYSAPKSGSGVFVYVQGRQITDWGAATNPPMSQNGPSVGGTFSFVAPGGGLEWFANWPTAPDCSAGTPVNWTLTVIS